MSGDEYLRDDPDDAWAAHELELEREHRTLWALSECRRAGVAAESLDFLAGELGLRLQWAQYLKAEPEPKPN